MRLPNSRWLRRAAVVTTGTIVVTGAGVYYFRRYAQSNRAASGNAKVSVPSLTAVQFNALQNQDVLRQALNARHMPWTHHKNRPRNAAHAENVAPAAMGDCNHNTKECTSESGCCCWLGAVTNKKKLSGDDFVLDFFRLLGCPYCAKVEAVLRFYDVPYRTIVVDPIAAKELPDPRYTLAPQLRFTGATDSTRQVLLVDSHTIVSALAGPLGYTSALQNARVSTTREWIDTHFQGASFAMVNGTLRDAYSGYRALTPPIYHTTLSQLIGTAALYLLAQYKIGPRVLATAHPLNDAYFASKASAISMQQQRTSTGKVAVTETKHADESNALRDSVAHHYTRPARTEDWLREELSVFLAQRSGSGLFHGGTQPDLADIEMYGVTRVLSTHPRFAPVLQSDEFGAWQRAMESVKMDRNGYL